MKKIGINVQVAAGHHESTAKIAMGTKIEWSFKGLRAAEAVINEPEAEITLARSLRKN